MYCSQKLGEDFAKFLWPSQNILTLTSEDPKPTSKENIEIFKVGFGVCLRS